MILLKLLKEGDDSLFLFYEFFLCDGSVFYNPLEWILLEDYVPFRGTRLQIKEFSTYPPNFFENIFTLFQHFIFLFFCVRTQQKDCYMKRHYYPLLLLSEHHLPIAANTLFCVLFCLITSLVNKNMRVRFLLFNRDVEFESSIGL